MDAPSTLPPVIQAELNASVQLSEWLQEHLSTTMTLGEDVNRQRLALVFFNIALETREAVILLVAKNARSPAVALGRPMLDAVVRGLWFQDGATTEHVKDFLDGRFDPTFDGMLKGLKNKIPAGTLVSLRQQFKTFSDFTHGSHRQVMRWLITADHSPGHTDRDMVQLLQAADRFGLAAAIRREAMASTDVSGFGVQMKMVMTRVKHHDEGRSAKPEDN